MISDGIRSICLAMASDPDHDCARSQRGGIHSDVARGKGGHTSYLAFKTVMGLSTNPTDVLAIAPATRFPWTDNLTKADWEDDEASV